MIRAIYPTTIYHSIIRPPIDWINNKITQLAQLIFGYIARVTNFQLGVIKDRTSYIVMRIYQRLSSDPREERPLDLTRLAESKKLLIQFGGVESVVQSPGAEIHCMTFKSADFYKAFEQKGCIPIDIIYKGCPRKVFINPPNEADKFYFPRIKFKLHDGGLVDAVLLPESPKFDGETPMILHCHSPGRSMAMDRKFIGQHLAAGYDVTVWDPRGTIDSTGTPSEGGYYLDAEAVLHHVIDLGYPANRIYVSGFCKGAACAVYLKKHFHDVGVHLIASNPYTSLTDVMRGYGWIGRMGIQYGLQALKDPSLQVEQDSFDNLAKLRNLPQSEGRFVLIHTDTDNMMPPKTVQRMIEVIANAGPVAAILRKHPDPTVNGHLQPPYEDPVVWREYIKVVT